LHPRTPRRVAIRILRRRARIHARIGESKIELRYRQIAESRMAMEASGDLIKDFRGVERFPRKRQPQSLDRRFSSDLLHCYSCL
jgi:hypothetical protein